jgi:hypothetical protein
MSNTSQPGAAAKPMEVMGTLLQPHVSGQKIAELS